jgi:hypothetical protein
MRDGRLAGELSREKLARRDCEERIVRLASGLPEQEEGAAA